MVKNAFALQTVQTEKESALMQNGYSQKKYQHALYGIRISVVMQKFGISARPKKTKTLL